MIPEEQLITYRTGGRGTSAQKHTHQIGKGIQGSGFAAGVLAHHQIDLAQAHIIYEPFYILACIFAESKTLQIHGKMLEC
jgi:hypothetical protein